MKVFVVNGQGGSGKDTFEKMVRDAGNEDCYNFYRYAKSSIIFPIKRIAESIGWKESKEMRDRLLLSRLKDLLSEYNDSPYQTLKKEIESYKEKGIENLFVDAREPSDIERLKKDFNATTILVKRGNMKHYGNHADDGVFNINYDIVIDNNGTIAELKEKAKEFYFNYIKYAGGKEY